MLNKNLFFLFIIFIIPIKSQGFGFQVCNKGAKGKFITIHTKYFGKGETYIGCMKQNDNNNCFVNYLKYGVTTLQYGQCHTFPWEERVYRNALGTMTQFLDRYRLSNAKICTAEDTNKSNGCFSISIKTKKIIRDKVNNKNTVIGKIEHITHDSNYLYMPRYKIKQSTINVAENFKFNIHVIITKYDTLLEGFHRIVTLGKSCNSMITSNAHNCLLVKCRFYKNHIKQNFLLKIKEMDKFIQFNNKISENVPFRIQNSCKAKNKHKTTNISNCTPYLTGLSKIVPPGSYLKTCKIVLYSINSLDLFAVCSEQPSVSLYNDQNVSNTLGKASSNYQVYSSSVLNLKNKACEDIINQHGVLTCKK